jgi:hypothetical protein
MASYVVLAFIVLAVVWLVVHLRRHPPMPARRPFEADHGESLIGSRREPPDPTAYANLRAGDGSGGVL